MTQHSSPRRVAFAAAAGATIEWYDFFLYGAAAGLVFDRLFFSGLSPAAAQLAAFATFAIGFIARPVGGLIFGHFGDRVGRKKMLLITLVTMGLGTAAIGLLPTYDQIGLWAPVLLIVLRIAQGIGVGGEYGGAVLLAVEYAPAERRGFLGSFAHIGVPGGLLLASGAFWIAGLLPDEAFYSWGWRTTFVASLLLLAIGAYIRMQVTETPAFETLQAEEAIVRAPFVEAFRNQPKRILLAMGTRFVEGFTFNFYSVYLLAYIATDLALPRSWALGGTIAGAALGVLLVPIAGALSDRFGRRPVYSIGALLGLVALFPVAALVQSESRWAIFAALVIGLGPVYGIVYGPLASFWAELFDTRYRYSALGAVYQISGIVASGLTPLIAAWLVHSAGGTLWGVATYGVVGIGVSLLCAWLLPETRGRDLQVDERPTRSTAARPEASVLSPVS